MDNRLVLAVLFVTLSWVSVARANNATSAPNATTATPTISAGNNTTSAPATTTAINMTSAPATTAATNMTSAPATTAAANMTSAPATTAAANMTSAPATTVATNMTSAPATTAATNMTSAPATTTATAGNNTTAAPTTGETTAAPLTPNTTVVALETPISNAGCGTKQLCATQPASCNPAEAGSCYFLAAKRQSGQNFEFGLAGESDGYIAASISTDSTLGGNDTTYVCANDNGVVKFFSTVLDNGKLIEKTLNVNSVKGKVNGKTIQCTFAATVPDPVTRASGVALGVSTGAYDSSSGILGAPSTQIKSPVVDLGNPNATVTNELATNATNTTPSPNTTVTASSYSFTVQQSLTQALLISAGVLSLTMV